MIARDIEMKYKYTYCGGIFGCDSNSHPSF
jgi:hypothetical protein